ncbi:MAG: response regulator, partial [Anaerolineae bacterium]
SRGSVFSFALPLQEKLVSLTRQPNSTAPLRQRVKPEVLLLGDDGMAAHYLERRLDGFRFLSVLAPQELTDAVLDRGPVAVIANRRGDRDGAPAWRGLLDRLPEHVPVLECPLPGSNWLSGEGQFAAVLTKPVTAEDLLGTVARVLNDGTSAQVVVVDDDRGFVQLLARILQTATGKRYEVITAYSGQEALHKIRRAQPQLVLLDLRLPDLSGFEVLAQLRNDVSLRETPVVAVSAATPGEDHLAVDGAFFTLVKRGSFRPGELVRLIAAALAAGHSGGATPDSVPVPS